MIHINIDPILLRWGDVTIGWHGLWWMAGLFIAFQIFIHEGRRRGVDPNHLFNFIVWGTIAGFIGARLLYVLQNWKMYAAQPARILMLYEGGIRLYGALIAGMIVMVGYARWKSLPFWSLADAWALALPVGEIIGRVGCTINGDVWGEPTSAAWGLVYWHPDALIPAYLRGVPTFPIPTMIQIWSAGLLVLLLMLRERLRSPGSLFLICLTVYSLGRFTISTWQPQEQVLLGLKQTQVVSLSVISLGILLLLYLRKRASSQ
jgi:phosphatidylglycerol:prolipoprotein diacylglycerol transferase